MNGEKVTLPLCEPLVRLTHADVDTIVDIELRSFPHPWSRTSFLQELSRSDSYSYGAASGRFQTETPFIAYICYRRMHDTMHLLKIAVSPPWRCRGVASFLLNRCLGAERKEGLVTSFLEVRPTNQSAIALYNRLGFQTIGRQPNYYADTREDALIMMKNLKEGS